MTPRLSNKTKDEEQPLLLLLANGKPTVSSYDSATTNDDVESLTLSEESSSLPQPTQVLPREITVAHLLLLFVAILYGSLNVSLRAVFALPDPPSASALSTIRGWLCVLCFAPLLRLHQTQQQPTVNSCWWKNKDMWKVGAELAVWNFGAQGLVNIGLLYVPSARAAFFTQTSVVITPMLSALFGTKVQTSVWWACGFALSGLVLMSQKENSGISLALGFGDILVLCGAVSWSTYMFRLSAVGDLYEEIPLQAIKNFLLAGLYSVWCLIELHVTGGECPWLGWTSLTAWALLFYSALGPGTVADIVQQKAQATVSATVSNIILSMEPVFTALFGRFLLGEVTSWMEKMGGCLILTAAIVATTFRQQQQ